MAVSGSIDFNPGRDTVIYRALRMLGAYSTEGNPSATQITDASTVLNIMLKEWQTENLPWLRRKAYLFLNEGQSLYYLGNSGSFSHCATYYVETTLSADAASGAGTVSLTSATGMSSGGFLGVENDEGTIEWFYATFSGDTATLFSDVGCSAAATLTAAASSGNVVYYHTVASQIARPLDVYGAWRKTSTSEIEIDVVSRSDFFGITNKTSQSEILQAYYDPQQSLGELSVWPTSNSCTTKLILDIDRPIYDMDASDNTFDLPIEVMNAVAYNLALELEPEYPLSPSAYAKLRDKANEKKAIMVARHSSKVPTTFYLEL